VRGRSGCCWPGSCAGTPGAESLLIRPDGIVAWGAGKDDEPAQELAAALARWFSPSGGGRSP
jgi:hypothetical protein